MRLGVDLTAVDPTLIRVVGAPVVAQCLHLLHGTLESLVRRCGRAATDRGSIWLGAGKKEQGSDKRPTVRHRNSTVERVGAKCNGTSDGRKKKTALNEGRLRAVEPN